MKELTVFHFNFEHIWNHPVLCEIRVVNEFPICSCLIFSHFFLLYIHALKIADIVSCGDSHVTFNIAEGSEMFSFPILAA